MEGREGGTNPGVSEAIDALRAFAKDLGVPIETTEAKVEEGASGETESK